MNDTLSTSAAKWRIAGDMDPHGNRYDCERAALFGGKMTDDEVANAVFLSPDIQNLTAAKDRIRWLSRALEAEIAARHSPSPAGVTEAAVEALRLISTFANKTLISNTHGPAYSHGANAAFEEAASIASEALAAIPLLSPSMGWEPIDSAPKDGTWIEMWRPLPTEPGAVWAPMVVARWDTFVEAWAWPDQTFEVFTEWGQALSDRLIARGDHFGSNEFTHWRPLTLPPANGEGR